MRLFKVIVKHMKRGGNIQHKVISNGEHVPALGARVQQRTGVHGKMMSRSSTKLYPYQLGRKPENYRDCKEASNGITITQPATPTLSPIHLSAWDFSTLQLTPLTNA